MKRPARARVISHRDREVVIHHSNDEFRIEQTYGNLMDTQIQLSESAAKSLARWILKEVK